MKRTVGRIASTLLALGMVVSAMPFSAGVTAKAAENQLKVKAGVGTLRGAADSAAQQKVVANKNDTYQFVFVPATSTSGKIAGVTLTYGVLKDDKVESIKTVAMMGKPDGSFVSTDIYVGDAAAKIVYYYTVDGVNVLDGTAKDTVKVGDTTYSVYEKSAFTGRMVSLPGTVNGNGWNPSKKSETFTYEGNGIYKLTEKNLGAGSYQYKIAIGGKWDENYGKDGVDHGDNIELALSETSDVTFTYNDISHRVVDSQNYVFTDISLTGTGVSGGTKLSDDLLKGIYSTDVTLAAGTYSDFKYVHDGTEYAVPEFKLAKGKKVTFYFDPTTEVYYNNASDTPVNSANIYYNSKRTSYKEPYGAVATGEKVTFRIQTGTDATEARLVMKGKNKLNVKMIKDGAPVGDKQMWKVEETFDTIGEYHYFFVISNGASISVYSDDNSKNYGEGMVTDLLSAIPYDMIVYKSGFKTPDWMKNAIIYQIFPDRFNNGDKSNDLAQTSSRGAAKYEYISEWGLYPENPEQEKLNAKDYPSTAFKGDGSSNNEIYGGDIQGIIDRMDYLKALGVNVIYINPVCSSVSSHRYDVSDYSKLDPILGDMGDFDKLTKVAKENGMKIVLDGVFNHVSDDSVYFDRYYKYLNKGTKKIGAYPFWAYAFDLMKEDGKLTKTKAAEKAKAYFKKEYGITDFTYTKWFEFTGGYLYDTNKKIVNDTIGNRKGKPVYEYECWEGYDSMPVIMSTNGSEYQTPGWAKEIIGTEENATKDDGSVTKYWIEHGSNGWRLDAANEVSDETWRHFRQSVKALNADNVIIGESWTDDAKYLLGDMQDSLMNYMFRNAVVDYVRDGNLLKCVNTLERLRERYPKEAFYAMMNLVGSHDTTRILSYLDGIDDNQKNKTVAAAFPTYETTSERAKRLQYVVAFIQMTYAGAPMIYYGDEIGMVGADDPDDRRTMTWGEGNKELVEWYAYMTKIRSEYSALRTGSITLMTVNKNVLGYVRTDADATLAVMANNTEKDITEDVNFKDTGLADGAYTDLISGNTYEIKDGSASVTIPAYKGVVLVSSDKAKKITINSKALAPAYDPAYIVKRASQFATDSKGNKYYYNASGKKVTNAWVTAFGRKYYCTKSGKISVNKIITVKKNKYYVDKAGRMVTNKWVTVKGKKYYCKKSGKIATNQILKVKNYKVYVGKDGRMVTKKWIKVKGKKYYCTKTGKLAKHK